MIQWNFAELRRTSILLLPPSFGPKPSFMKLFLPSLLLLAIAVPSLQAQNGDVPFSCKANDLHLLDPARAEDPALLAQIATLEAELEVFTQEFALDASRGGGSYTIPVVFHIIHENGPENISDEQVFDAMRVLNDDFNKLNSDWQNVRPEFLGIVSDVGVNFALAQKDPQGNCTKGITRTVSALTNVGDQDMKDLIQWPRNKYMNVWVCAYADGAAGYTYRPGAADFFPTGDGIVLLHNYTGAIGTSSPGRSRTLTHETGHWLNLKHTWGDSNEPIVTSNCSDDDSVSDTPNTVGWTSCVLSGISCGSLDNVENYMDYSYCSKMFTEGQKTRMIAALNSGTAQRSSLWTTNNLNATGVGSPAILCAAEFTSSIQEICAGSTVTFSDVSYNSVSSRTWSFPGGTPNTSTDPNPSVTYTTAGNYAVTLDVTDGTTNLSVTTNDLITVLANPGAAVPFNEGFESISSLNGSSWTVYDPDNNNTFQLTNAAAFSGSNSVRLLNTASMTTQLDEFYSEPFDMSNATEIVVTFRYAYAQRNTTNDDRLRLYVSNNCGDTWSMRKQLRGSSDLNTAGGTVSSSFVPSGDQWGYAEVTNISSSYHTSDFRIKFESESYGGNNIYVDDINLNGMPVGLEELSANSGSLMIIPNPAQDNAQLLIEMPSSDQVVIDLIDVTGRKLIELYNGNLAGGPQRIDLPISTLRSGVYMVRS